MSLDTFLSKKLQKFNIVDLAFIKFTYMSVGLLLISLFAELKALDWGFLLTFTILAALPLWINMFSQSGSYLEKANKYLKSNNPQKQMLLFLAMFGVAGLLGCFFPLILELGWEMYVIAIVLFAIKPATKSMWW